MQFKQSAAVLALVGVAAAGITQPFPLKNGFPTPSGATVGEIELAAGGGIPNIEFPTTISDDAATTFQLIGLEEILEVAFFTELIKNITKGVEGFQLKAGAKALALETLNRIHNQEQLHYLGANGALESAGKAPVDHCTYDFPVSNYFEALALANLFTDINISVAPLAQQLFADDGGQERSILVQVVGSIEVQEAQQVGFFRASRGKASAAAPFLTLGTNSFFATSLNRLIVKGSCNGTFPSNVPVFPELKLLTFPTANVTSLKFEVEGAGVSAAGNSLVYMTGISLPVTVPITKVKKMGKVTTFSAGFPFKTYSGGFESGLSFAALVKGHNKKYTTPLEVSADTVNLAFLEVQ